MRIIIDMQGAQIGCRSHGIGLYTLSFAQAVARNRENHEVLLVLNGLFPDSIEPIRYAFDGLIPQSHIRVWLTPGQIGKHDSRDTTRLRIAEIVREAFIASLRPDVIHVSDLFNGFWEDAISSIDLLNKHVPVSVSLHDLRTENNQDQPMILMPDFVAHYDSKISYLRKAELILASSRSCLENSRQSLGLGAGTIINASTVVDPCFRILPPSSWTTSSLLVKYKLTRPFAICIVNPNNFEDLALLLRAWSSLPKSVQSAHQIVIIGMQSTSVAEASEIQKSALWSEHNHITFIDCLEVNELGEIYNLSKLVIIPSLLEGVGLIAKEALACGAAVIGPDTSSLREYITAKKALFSPTSFVDFEEKLHQALTDATYLNSIRRQDAIHRDWQSWDDVAKRTIIEWQNISIPREVESPSHRREPDTSPIPALARHIAFLNDNEIDSLAECIAINHNDLPIKQVLVDVSHLVVEDARTGIQRVVRSILCELMHTPPEGFTIEPVYATMDAPYRYARRYAAEIRDVSCEYEYDDVVLAGSGDIFLGLDLQHMVVPAQKAELHRWRNLGVSIWFAVYDLLPISLPDCFLPDVKEHHHKWLQVIAEFDGAVCISKAVADELLDWLHNHPPVRHRPFSVDWFHLGADLEASAPTRGWPANGELILSSIRSKMSFLMVSTVEPRKGHEQVLSAFEKLWERGFNANLVVVGKQGWRVDALAQRMRRHSEYGERLLWLEGISDEYLNEVYAASTCLIVASKGEGFGLPLIEAAQHRLPIITRDLPVFREVAGDHAFYFSGHEAEDIAHAVECWMSQFEKGLHPRSDNMPWLTWKESANQLLRIILPKDGPQTQYRSQTA